MRRAALLPLLIACFVAGVWLNQGRRHDDAVARAEQLVHPAQSVFAWPAFFFLQLYMRSGDEEIYHADASAMRGLPYDHKRLVQRGDGIPPGFDLQPPEDGHWHRPYTELPSEYNAVLFPWILLPSFVAGTDYELFGKAFSLLMAVLILGACALAMRVQRDRDPRQQWRMVSWLLIAEGSLVVQRLDAVPAFLLALGVWAAAERRHAAFGAALGMATAVKFLPVLLIAPIVAADREGWASTRAMSRGALGFGLAAAVGFAPMLFPPDALLGVLHYHSARGLQIESTWAVLLGAWELLTGTAVPPANTFGSFNLPGPTAEFLAHLSAPVTVVLILGLTAALLRLPAARDDGDRRDRIAIAALLGLCVLWLTAKVFSPQYLTWGLPLVLAVSGRLGRTLTWLFFAVLFATQTCLCGIYVFVARLTPIGQSALMIRLALLAAFATVLLRAILAMGVGREESSTALAA
jgi:hypothetical protein